MTVKQALKAKNLLAVELNELYNLIRSNNSNIVGNPKHYVLTDLLIEADSKLLELVTLKAKIHKANEPVYDKIFMLSELKNKAQQYKNISAIEGKQTNSYSKEEPVVYEVELNVKQIKDLVKGIEVLINEIQEELDTFNARTEI